ncbi:MAG: hypothetical protein ACI4AH_01380 [Muribaculaceae bacterium]
MNISTIIVLIVVLALVIAAILHILRHGSHSCCGCDGKCAHSNKGKAAHPDCKSNCGTDCNCCNTDCKSNCGTDCNCCDNKRSHH